MFFLSSRHLTDAAAVAGVSWFTGAGVGQRALRVPAAREPAHGCSQTQALLCRSEDEEDAEATKSRRFSKMFREGRGPNGFDQSAAGTTGTLTRDSVPGVAVRAATAPEGGGGSDGLTGNAGKAGRVGTGHMARQADPLCPLLCGRSPKCGGLWRRRPPATGDAHLWLAPPTGQSSGGGCGRGGRGGSGGRSLSAGVWFGAAKWAVCTLTCKTLQVRGQLNIIQYTLHTAHCQ